MKKAFLKICVIFLICVIQVQALSPLPKNSYLQLGDNLKEVKILQEILNSDPDTEIIDVGPGSPGNEKWYFGKLTENALKRFQEKNGIEATGRIDFKTWKVLNNYVTTPNPSLTGVEEVTKSAAQNKINSANQINNTLNQQNKKDFEAAKLAASEKKKVDTETKASESKSYIQNLLDKYTGFFTSKSDTNTSTQNSTSSSLTTQNYQDQNYNPYLSQPSQIQPQQPFNPNQYSFGQNSPYGNQQSSYQQQPSFTNGLTQGLIQGAAYNTSRLAGGDGRGNGFGLVVTTVYGHERNGGSDALDNGITACGQNSRLGGNGAKAVSLKKSLRVSIFGNVSKSGWCGKEVEVTNPRTGKCGVYPLLEEGPAEYLQASMDLTGTVWNELDPSGRDGGKAMMQFKILKADDIPCVIKN